MKQRNGVYARPSFLKVVEGCMILRTNMYPCTSIHHWVFLAKGTVLKHSLSRIQGWHTHHRGSSYIFLVFSLLCYNLWWRTLSIQSHWVWGIFNRTTWFVPANPQENWKQIWVKNFIFSGLRLWILDEIMPQIKYSCCIFVVRMLDLLCIQ